MSLQCKSLHGILQILEYAHLKVLFSLYLSSFDAKNEGYTALQVNGICSLGKIELLITGCLSVLLNILTLGPLVIPLDDAVCVAGVVVAIYV